MSKDKKWNVCQEKIAKYTYWIKIIALEILMVVFGFGNSVRNSYTDNLLYRRICNEYLNNDTYLCFAIQNKGNLTKKYFEIKDVLDFATTHTFVMIGMRILAEFFSSCFLCSWSDKYGRKLSLILAFLGGNLDVSSFFFRNIPMVYFMWSIYLTTIFSGFFGSFICIFAMTYSYVSDHSSLNYRTLKFTTVDVSYMLGEIIGVRFFENVPMKDILRDSFLYVISVRIFSIMWIWFFFEDRNFDGKGHQTSKKFKTLFMISNTKECFASIGKWRKKCGREQMRLIIFSAMPIMVAYGLIEGVRMTNSHHSMLFINIINYKRVTEYFAIYTCLSEIVVILFSQYIYRISDAVLGVLGFINLYLYFSLAAFSSNNLTFIVALSLAPLKAFAIIALRSSYSKIIGEDERGFR
ncbi:uncharacterized protein LOC118198240 isoform X2 [Stegodyphus dumicola]|uniref:uncharacterized protein LOC118198240 isoform X2 n=1 Tax=Stegodyphus dumicola TaxID=202533 RepID=UPI0015AB2050|nr:uncharacterized protein LOC118198240 isoform X2 [Stegodyphus dumicola]